ncbi:MAG TPA: YchJ family metal-binding protein, partial [Cellulomonas sp.]
FAVGDASYLLRTWHPSTRPEVVGLDPRTTWVRLDVLATTAGGVFDRAGTVEFRAHYRDEGGRGSLHEHSRFVREADGWQYVDGDVRTDGS